MVFISIRTWLLGRIRVLLSISRLALMRNTMNATDYLNFKLPVETQGKAHKGGPELIPHPDNGTPRPPSSTKLISRLTGNGSFD